MDFPPMTGQQIGIPQQIIYPQQLEVRYPFHTRLELSEDEKYEEKVNLKWKREDEERRQKEEAIIRNQFKVHDIEFIADLNINVKKWIQETWIICNRYRVGVRPQTEILASVFNHLNLDLDQINLSKSPRLDRNQLKRIQIVFKKTTKCY